MGGVQATYSHFTAPVSARYFALTCCVLACGDSSILSAAAVFIFTGNYPDRTAGFLFWRCMHKLLLIKTKAMYVESVAVYTA